MSTPGEERQLVDTLRGVQLKALRTNRWKGHWHEESVAWLLKRLHGELGELVEVLMADKPDPDAVERECADVANFAAMIADNARTGE